MRYRKLPQNIRMRVQEFYEHRYRKKYFNEELILEELSTGLKEVCTSYFPVNFKRSYCCPGWLAYTSLHDRILFYLPTCRIS